MGRVVVVGASVAGVAACEALRADGFDGELVLVGAETGPPYDRPPLSKQLLTGDLAPQQVRLRDAETFAELRVQQRLRIAARSLDSDARRVWLEGGESMAYDGLVICTGARARPMPGQQPRVAGLHLLRTLDDALALRAGLRSARRVVIVGAGFIGLEVASCARARGCRVTVVEAAPHPLARVLPESVGMLFADLHARHGVMVHCGVDVVEVATSGGTVEGVRLGSGETVPADLLVVGVGATPNDDWLAGSGLGVADGVLCDETLRAAPGVYACGDVARWPHPLFGSIRVEHWTTAVDHARTAASNLADELSGVDRPARVAAAVPYFWSDQHGVKVQMAGWAPGADALSVVTEGSRIRALLGREGRLVATMTWNWPRELAARRRQVAAAVGWDELGPEGLDVDNPKSL